MKHSLHPQRLILAVLLLAALDSSVCAAEVRIGKDSIYCFSAGDFADPARGIYVDAVPSASTGTLCYGDRVLCAGDVLPVAALGEIWMGAAQGCRSAVMVTLGTGVGGGVIVNGKVIDGAHGAGGEIGHITVNPHETAVCGCGKRGCLEQYSSATGVVRCMKKLLDANPDTACTLRGKDFEAKDVFDAARAGDALAAREVDEMASTLGMALANIAATTDPEMFMIGGGVARAGEVLFNPLVRHYKEYAFQSCKETPIKAASLGNDAGIYGAVRLIVGA